MKKTLFIIILINLFFFQNNTYAKSKTIASVKMLKGKAYYASKQNKKYKRLKINQKIKEDTIVKTSKKSKITLFLKGGSLIELNEYTQIIINKNLLNKSSTSLLKGKANFKIKKILKQRGSFSVFTPTAVAAVRGTEYEIGIADDGSLLVNVDEGEVAVGNNKGEVSVKENQSAEVSIDDNELIKEDKKKNIDDWDKKKNKELQDKPVDKMNAVKNNLKETLKNQKKTLKDLDSAQVEDSKKAEQDVDTALFNQCKSEGLMIAARNIRNKNKKNKKIRKMYKDTKSVYSKLKKLNKLIDKKFNKLDKIFEQRGKELDKRFKDAEKKFDDKFKNKNSDIEKSK